MKNHKMNTVKCVYMLGLSLFSSEVDEKCKQIDIDRLKVEDNLPINENNVKKIKKLNN